MSVASHRPELTCSGIFISGYCQSRFGYRRTIQAGLIWLAGAIFVTFLLVAIRAVLAVVRLAIWALADLCSAKDIQMLFAGELLCGLAFGGFTTVRCD